MQTLKAAETFPERIQEKLVGERETEVVYRFQVPIGTVAFIYLAGLAPLPDGAYVIWTVDGEEVVIPELGVATPIRQAFASLDNPLKIDPPIVCEDETTWKVYSPVDCEFKVLCDGEVYRVPVSEEIKEEVARTILAPKPSTHPQEWKNIEVDGVWEMCDIKGPGYLYECLVVTTATDFDLVVVLDGRRPYEGSYSEYQALSVYVDEITAMQSDSNYRVHLAGLSFNESLRIYVKGTLTLSRAFLKVEY